LDFFFVVDFLFKNNLWLTFTNTLSLTSIARRNENKKRETNKKKNNNNNKNKEEEMAVEFDPSADMKKELSERGISCLLDYGQASRFLVRNSALHDVQNI